SNLGKPDTEVRELSIGYRVPRQILDYASTLLAVIAPELRPASPLRAGPGAVIAADPQVPALASALQGAGLEYGSPGSDARLTLVPVTLAKGLEYDHVIVVEPAQIAAAEARGLQRLYVALTRAVSRLTVLYAEPLPAPLRSCFYVRSNALFVNPRPVPRAQPASGCVSGEASRRVDRSRAGSLVDAPCGAYPQPVRGESGGAGA